MKISKPCVRLQPGHLREQEHKSGVRPDGCPTPQSVVEFLCSGAGRPPKYPCFASASIAVQAVRLVFALHLRFCICEICAILLVHIGFEQILLYMATYGTHV